MAGQRLAISFSDLWRWDGTISRERYVLYGLILFALKFNLDRFVSSQLFHHQWGLLDYFFPGQAFDLLNLPAAERKFYAIMVAMALPFIWSGVVLTVRRLRDAGLPLWLVKLFFFPFVNLVFFLVLSVLPRAEQGIVQEARALSGLDEEVAGRQAAHHRGWFGRKLDSLLSQNLLVSGATSVLLPLPFAVILVFLGVSVLRHYGWGLFVGIPFALGMVSSVLYGSCVRRTWFECVQVSIVAVTALGAVLLAISAEGFVCLLMAYPIALVIGIMGALLGYAIQKRPVRPGESPLMILLVFLFLPVLMGAEYAVRPAAPTFMVRSLVEVNASQKEVWQHVISFSELPPPDDWVLKSGIAYPVRAEIQGRGPGAIRHCVFTTGPFVEPIEVWDEPRLLRFSVVAQPKPMREQSLLPGINPPHLDGYLVSRAGQFLLTPLARGRTRLEGTTWYRHHMWPAAYWRIWSDFIIHRIHMRVLNHVKALSEQQAAASKSQ